MLSKLRKGEGPFWGTLKKCILGVLKFHIPVNVVTKPLFQLLYLLHVSVRETLSWLVRFFWYEPLFRSQCVSVGSGLRMEQLPYILGSGKITIGSLVRLSGKSNFIFGNCLKEPPKVSMGDGTFIGHDCAFHIASELKIGKHCLLAGKVSIYDMDGHPIDADERRANKPTPPEGVAPVHIGDDVWLGTGCLILKGVTIGDRSIVAARAVVTKSVPADVVVAGNPAKVVKQLTAPESPAS